MWRMANRNDLEGITRCLDEGVDPAADEEGIGVRLMVGSSVGSTLDMSLCGVWLMRC